MANNKKALKVVVIYANLDEAERQRLISRLAKLLLGPKPGDSDNNDKGEGRNDSNETGP